MSEFGYAPFILLFIFWLYTIDILDRIYIIEFGFTWESFFRKRANRLHTAW